MTERKALAKARYARAYIDTHCCNFEKTRASVSMPEALIVGIIPLASRSRGELIKPDKPAGVFIPKFQSRTFDAVHQRHSVDRLEFRAGV